MLAANQLIGFGVGGLSRVSLFDSSTSTSGTITAPSGISAGDLIVLLDSAGSGSGTPPTGFTQIDEQGGFGGLDTIASYKIATGTEGGASIAGMDSAFDSKCMYVFRGDSAISSVLVGSVDGELSIGNPSPQSVTASTGNAPLIVFGCYSADVGTLNGKSFTPEEDGSITANNGASACSISYKIYNSSPQDVSVDLGDSGGTNNVLQSFYISVT